MKNRRSDRRHEIAQLAVAAPVRGKVINASNSGIAIESAEALNVGWSYAFKMGQSPDIIRVPGRVRWCRQVEKSGRRVFRVGVVLAGPIWGGARVYPYP